VNGSVKKSTKAILADQEWRVDIGIKNYKDFEAVTAVKKPELYFSLQNLVGFWHGFSKRGRPVKVMRILSTLIPKKIKEVYDDGDVFSRELELLQAKESEHHHFVVVPFLMKENKAADHHHISIIDLDGFSSKILKSGLGRKIVKAVLSFYDKHYPDGACKVFLVNAPKAFSKAWNMFKRVLSKSLTSKIIVIRNDLRPLFECIDQSELPECIGGTSPYKLGDYPKFKVT